MYNTLKRVSVFCVGFPFKQTTPANKLGRRVSVAATARGGSGVVLSHPGIPHGPLRFHQYL